MIDLGDMDVVAFMNGKGGVGKSALARSYAVERARNKKETVLLCDLNEGQHTAVKWAAMRKANGFLPSIVAEAMGLRQVEDLRTSTALRPSLLVLDCGGWKDENSFKIATKLSTFVVVPCGPNIGDDVIPTAQFAIDLDRRFKAAGVDKPSTRYRVALVRFDKDSYESEARTVNKALASVDGIDIPVLAGVIRNVPAYGSALTVGRALTETPFDGLNKEAQTMMDRIDTHVRRIHKELNQEQGADAARHAGRSL